MRKFKKVLLIIVAVIAGLNILVHAALHTWQLLDKDAEIPKAIESVCESFYDYGNNEAVIAFKEKMGGTLTGVCHPQNDEYSLEVIKEANINYVRFDIPSEAPYELEPGTLNPKRDENNNIVLTESYKAFKTRCETMHNGGLKVMAITPYVDDMLNQAGLSDVFDNGGEYTDEFRVFVKEVSEFFATDLIGYVDIYQISNELDIDKWMGALTLEQVTEYQGIQLKAMYPITSEANIPLGFNLSAYSFYNYPTMMTEKYSEYFEYIALDLYLGCFEGMIHTTLVYDLLLKNLYHISKKPVMLNEFGYISTGNPKSDEEKAEWLNETYGESFNTEEKIKTDIMGFVSKHEEVTGGESPMTKEAKRLYSKALNDGKSKSEACEDVIDYLFSDAQISHIYRALPDGYKLTNYDHTQEGQAEFYKDLITRLSKNEYICGYFVYCYKDSEECYQCSGEGCPVETGWGLVTISDSGVTSKDDITLKPSYYAIQEVFGNIKEAEKEKYNK